MRSKLLVLILGSLFFCAELSLAQLVGTTISKQGDTDHIEFFGLNEWDYDVRKIDDQTFELKINALKEPALQKLKSYKGQIIREILVNPKGPDGKTLIVFKVANANVDSFDYLTDQPSRLILDFYLNPKTDSIKPKAAQKESVKKTELKAVSAENNGLAKDRKPATSDVLVIKKDDEISLQPAPEQKKDNKSGIFDGGDPSFERFTIKDYEIKNEAIIKSKENAYIAFPMLANQLSHLDSLETKQPIYEIIPKQTSENKEARLLLTLAEKKRYAVYLKTLAWFRQKYPQSEYNEIIDFLTADVYYSIWKEKQGLADFDLAMTQYRANIEKYPESKLVERTKLLMGFATLDRGDALGAIRIFQNYIQDKGNTSNKDISNLAMAQAYLKLNKYEEAILNYEVVETNSENEINKIEAAYLKGDVYIQKKDYKAAVAEYQKAIKKYPNSWSIYPNAFFNQAEALFWLEKYKLSLETYRDYLQRFPSHPHAGYAMTRLGEILEILGAPQEKVMGAYLEAQFRYGDSPTASTARLRMISNRMKNMKPNEVGSLVKEAEEIAKNSQLPKIDEFTKLLIADGYSSRQEYEKSIKMLAEYYQQNPTTADTKTLSNRIVKYINEEIRNEVDRKNFIKALQVHNKYAQNWLKGSERIDTKYYLGRSFELAGVAKAADELYRDTLNKITALQGTRSGQERNIFEKLPATDELYLRLAQSNFQLKKYNQALDYLKNIQNPDVLSEDSQIERIRLSAQVLEQKGDLPGAQRYLGELLREWRGIPAKVAPLYFNLAQLEKKAGVNEESIRSLLKVTELLKDAGQSDQTLNAEALEMLADLQLQSGDKKSAASTYTELLTQFEDKKPLNSIRYKLGEIYFKQGDMQKASTVWNDFKDQETNFWYKMAQEKLKSSEWENDYKNYIKRMPAAVGKEIR